MRLLRAKRITGWRRHLPLTGRPDFAFPSKRVAVFVDGCFWHGCPKHFKAPVSRAEFWREKIESNRRRDRAVSRMLRSSGWAVVRIWEHDLGHAGSARALARIVSALEGGEARPRGSQPAKHKRGAKDVRSPIAPATCISGRADKFRTHPRFQP